MEEKPTTKVCVQCGRELPLDAFYRQPLRLDQHFNKCKECVRGYSKSAYHEKMKNVEYAEKERVRKLKAYYTKKKKLQEEQFEQQFNS